MAKFYESEHTQFMREWLAQHPEQRDEKQRGRALWWDKEARSMDDLQRANESRVAQKPYCYDVNG
jgi:hypothetical protein